MRMSRDEVFEWACKVADKYKCHPMRPIGMLDTYLECSNMNHEKACKKIERQLEDELNGNKKAKDGKRAY